MFWSKSHEAEIESLMRPWLRLSLVGLPVTLAIALLEGVGIGLVMPLLQLMTGESSEGWFDTALSLLGPGYSKREQIIMLGSLIVALIVVKNVLSYLISVLHAHIYGRSGEAIRYALVARTLDAPYGFILGAQPSRILSAISNESWTVTESLQARIAVRNQGVMALILASFLFVISWQLSLVVLVGTLALHGLHSILARSLRADSSQVVRENAKLAERMLHLVHSGRLIRFFGQQRWEQRRFDKVSGQLRRTLFRLDLRKSMLGPIQEVLQSAMFVLVIIGAWLYGLALPIIATFLILLYRLQPQVRGLQNSLAQLDSWVGSRDAVRWLLAAPQERCETDSEEEGGAAPLAMASTISFRDTSFVFQDSEHRSIALDRVSFRITRGRPLAVIGHSGSGKTTLVNLLGRLLVPTQGAIEVDGAPAEEIPLAGWRYAIGATSSDLELVEGTIAQNIAYGDENASRQQIVEAARLADIDEFVRSLPEGYDTLVTYRGSNLSNGQKQRLALARAIVRDPDILVLDEATSGLDAISREKVDAVIENLSRDRFVVVVSHYVSAISYCQDVLLLREGKSVYQGAASDLQMADMRSLLEMGMANGNETRVEGPE